MDPALLGVMHTLRPFMCERVYLPPSMDPERRRAKGVVRDLVAHFMNQPDQVPTPYRHDDADQLTQVVDYVSGMTDRFAVATHDRIFRPALF